MSKTIKVALAGAGAFGIKHLDGIKNIYGVEVVSLISREGADELGLSLLESGLTMRSFHAHHGARPQPAPAAHPPAEPGVVLDILV